MDGFGQDDPRHMPRHFFIDALRVDYDTAVRSNPQQQNCSICPRYWYIDATFRCRRCGSSFAFTAAEQRTWYEGYGFWVDALPKHCLACRRDLRALKAARQEYDRRVADVLEQGDLADQRRLAELIDQLYELGGELPPRINENRRRIANQIVKAERLSATANE